jgi:RNA-dependent RNA polymerase
MELFMRNISFGCDETHIRVAVAEKVHKPPIQVDSGPPMNFGVVLFPDKRRRGHSGRGLVIFPEMRAANVFLEAYGGAGLPIGGRTVYFSPSTRERNSARIEKIRSTPWQDPSQVKEEKERRAKGSQPIVLSHFQFGRFGLDGSFSAEKQGRGEILCDLHARLLRIKVKSKKSNQETSFHFLPSTIVAMAEQDLSVILESSLPPVFQSSRTTGDHNVDDDISDYEEEAPTSTSMRTSGRDSIDDQFAAMSVTNRSKPQVSDTGSFENFLGGLLNLQSMSFSVEGVAALLNKLLDDDQPPERQSSFRGVDQIPPISLALRLVFSSQEDTRRFLDRSTQLHLPRAFQREIVVKDNHKNPTYSPANLERLNEFLRECDFPLAFEIDKAVKAGRITPIEVMEVLQPGIATLGSKYKRHAAQIFEMFVMKIPVCGLREIRRMPTVPVSKRRRRMNKRSGRDRIKVVPNRTDLQALLCQVMEDFLEALESGLQKEFTPSSDIYLSYRLVVTPTTYILEGPVVDQSNSVLRRFHGQSENFLRVTLRDENRCKFRREPDLSIDEILQSRYRPLFVRPVVVAGRNYNFLGYSMSGLREYSFTYVREFVYESHLMNADKIRNQLVRECALFI